LLSSDRQEEVSESDGLLLVRDADSRTNRIENQAPSPPAGKSLGARWGDWLGGRVRADRRRFVRSGLGIRRPSARVLSSRPVFTPGAVGGSQNLRPSATSDQGGSAKSLGRPEEPRQLTRDNFSATCSGTLTYTDLAVPIRSLEPPGPPPFDQPGFAFGRLSDDAASGTAINGHFSPDRRSASGQFVLTRYSGCGLSVLGTWDARRR
jgi:hypothetical protein